MLLRLNLVSVSTILQSRKIEKPLPFGFKSPNKIDYDLLT